MLKFFVIIFLFQGTTNLRYIGQTEVANAQECIEKVLAINTSDDNPYNAACVVNQSTK